MITTSSDYTEWVALGIVAAAFFVLLRGLFRKRAENCCGKTCPLKSPGGMDKKNNKKVPHAA